MITIIGPAENAVVVDNRQQSELSTHVFVAIGYHMRMTIRGMSERMERCFAAFAGVPYEDPLSRQQWEQLWETELQLSAPQNSSTRNYTKNKGFHGGQGGN